MKLKTILLGAIATGCLAQAASAQTVVDITGSTAFRGAAVTAIRAAFNASPAVQYGYTGTSFTSAGNHIFVGNFPGIAGTTIIRTSWTGSTEGARDVVGDLTVNAYLPTNSTVSTGGTQSLTGATQPGTPELYFTDVGIENTVYSATGVNASEDTRVGAIVFSMMKNQSSDPGFSSLTNITSQQFRALYSPATLGRLQLSQFTGLDTDDGKYVYATGRNDLSGTRTVYMLETGYGAANLVNQWKIITTASDNITALQQWPLNDGLNASSQWTLGVDVEGNGGYNSGGTLLGIMDDTSTSVNVTLADGSPLDTNANILLITMLGNLDAANSMNPATNPPGSIPLAYNGVSITPNSAGLSTADKAKIQNGSYTLWSFQRLYRSNEATPGTPANTVYNAVRTGLLTNPTLIGNAGLTMIELQGVERATDGAAVLIP